MPEAQPFLLAGKWQESQSQLVVKNPYDGSITATVCLAGEEDTEQALAAAASARADMAALPVYARARILTAIRDGIIARTGDLVDILVREGGKTRVFASTEVSRAAETIGIAAEEGKRINGEIIPLDWTEAGTGRTAFVFRVPLGPVLAITPFNYPLNLTCHKVGAAIAAGNPVIIKPASATPLTALVLGELILGAGLPRSAISVLPCHPGVAEGMVRDPRIACLSFTGSPEVGWHLHHIAGKKRVLLELGGNAAVIVCDDADLSTAIPRIVYGANLNAGQVCISVQRVFVHRSRYQEAEEALVRLTRAIRYGDPANPGTVVGPMISEDAAKRAESVLQDAVAGGATLLCGGGRDKALLAPAVLAHTTPEMAVNRAEVFAPVCTITPFDTFEEAISLANDSEFGLQIGIFTNDIRRIRMAAEQADFGGVIINDIPTYRADHMPYGGVKSSGIGREGPRFAIQEMTEQRLVVLNRT